MFMMMLIYVVNITSEFDCHKFHCRKIQSIIKSVFLLSESLLSTRLCGESEKKYGKDARCMLGDNNSIFMWENIFMGYAEEFWKLNVYRFLSFYPSEEFLSFHPLD